MTLRFFDGFGPNGCVAKVEAAASRFPARTTRAVSIRVATAQSAQSTTLTRLAAASTFVGRELRASSSKGSSCYKTSQSRAPELRLQVSSAPSVSEKTHRHRGPAPSGPRESA